MSEFYQLNIGYCVVVAIPLILIMISSREKRICVMLGYFLYGTIMTPFATFFNSYFIEMSPHREYSFSSITPVVEELLKSLPILIIYTRKKAKIDFELFKLIVVIDAGFSIFESINYLHELTLDFGHESSIIALAIVRSLTAAIIHISTTGFIALMVFLLKDNRQYIFVGYWGALAIAILVHGIYNLLVLYSFTALAMIIPLAVWLLQTLIAKKILNDTL
jgi:RsiW-degrading membrane proteinase PrsW (M82 family)